nr:MAG TPA: hypothetical protein [Caudoviricetes sp.]
MFYFSHNFFLLPTTDHQGTNLYYKMKTSRIVLIRNLLLIWCFYDHQL